MNNNHPPRNLCRPSPRVGFLYTAAAIATCALLSGCTNTSDTSPAPQTSTSTTTTDTSKTKDSIDNAMGPDVKSALTITPIDRTVGQRNIIEAWCLRGKGLDANVSLDDPTVMTISNAPEGDPRATMRLSDDCADEYQLRIFKELTRADGEKEFKHRLSTKKCMEARGIVITAPPSKAKFIDSFLHVAKTGEDIPVWSPWEEFLNSRGDNVSEHASMQLDCPRHHPDT